MNSSIDALYIADHICRIEYEYANNPTMAADSLYRIASNTELFGNICLLKFADFTPEQRAQLNAWIEEFRRSPEGAEAIDRVRAAMRAGYRQPERRDLFAVAPWQRLGGFQ